MRFLVAVALTIIMQACSIGGDDSESCKDAFETDKADWQGIAQRVQQVKRFDDIVSLQYGRTKVLKLASLYPVELSSIMTEALKGQDVSTFLKTGNPLPEGQKFVVETDGRRISSVADWISLIKEGWEPMGSYDTAMDTWFRGMALPLMCVQKMQPATSSFVREITFNDNIVNMLPIELAAPVLLNDANERGGVNVQWRPLSAICKRVKRQLGGKEIADVICDDEIEMVLKVAAWGDVDSDGIDDLVVTNHTLWVGGSEAEYHVYVVTKKSQEGRLLMLSEVVMGGLCN